MSDHGSEEQTLNTSVNLTASEICADLEYHALMGVKGGDEPTIHDRSFERNASPPISRVRKVMVRHTAETALI